MAVVVAVVLVVLVAVILIALVVNSISSSCGSSKILIWTGKYKSGVAARAGKYKLGAGARAGGLETQRFFFIYVIIFTMHEKHIAREPYLESPQRYMMKLFGERADDFKP